MEFHYLNGEAETLESAMAGIKPEIEKLFPGKKYGEDYTIGSDQFIPMVMQGNIVGQKKIVWTIIIRLDFKEPVKMVIV